MAPMGTGASRGRSPGDRVISTVDPDTRHAHKTVHRRQDGFKAHIAVEPDTGIITACALTKASGADNHEAVVGLALLDDEDTRCGCSAIRPTAPAQPGPRWPRPGIPR